MLGLTAMYISSCVWILPPFF